MNRLTLNFISRLRSVGVPIPYPGEQMSAIKIHDRIESYSANEIQELKAENYDLRREIDILRKKLKEKKK